MMPPNNQRSQPELVYGKLYDDAARHTLDFDFISRNPDYKHLVAMIDTGDHNWLDMGDEDKIDLLARGAAAAAEFLQVFNWTKYNIRKGIADTFLASYANNGATLHSR